MADPTISREGHNCWTRARAGRLAFLVDARAYFENLAATLENARRSVLIVGWDVHSRVQLRRDAGEDGQLVRILDRLVARRPELHVHLLVWDCNMFCKVAREKLQTLRLGWQTHSRIHFRLDAEHPVGACHHQKIVVVDDAVAFVGGIDLTARRWDTVRHAADEQRRVDPSGEVYAPFHDVQVAVSGPAAQALGRLVRDRWQRATGEKLAAPEPSNDPWPTRLEPWLRQVEVGIARTDPEHGGRSEVREIEALYRDAIRASRRWVFIENQYLTSDAICRLLIELLQREHGPELCIIGPLRVTSWIEDSVMGALRSRVVERLREADRADRLRIWYPRRSGSPGEPIVVHSKLCVVDERFVTVGSANLSNRSLGLDTECNVFFEAAGDGGACREIAAFRNRLLAEHLGCAAGEVAEAIERHGSLNRAVETLRGGERTLERLDPDPPGWSEALLPAERLLDPERPLEWNELVRRFFAS